MNTQEIQTIREGLKSASGNLSRNLSKLNAVLQDMPPADAATSETLAYWAMVSKLREALDRLSEVQIEMRRLAEARE